MKQRIVLAWEWGAGAGHLAQFVPIVKHFADDESVELVLAARDVTHVRRLFADNTGTLRVGSDAGFGIDKDCIVAPKCLAQRRP